MPVYFQVNVWSMRTDDHRQLEIAMPDASKPADHIDNQVWREFECYST